MEALCVWGAGVCKLRGSLCLRVRGDEDVMLQIPKRYKAEGFAPRHHFPCQLPYTLPRQFTNVPPSGKNAWLLGSW